MRKDNPHISKRRGGRKANHRRFSLQPFHHKHMKHREHIEKEPVSMTDFEVSRTPEESTNSNEGITVIIEDSEKAHPVTTQTVTFKPGTKEN